MPHPLNPGSWVLVFTSGVLCGFLNSIASSGSAITLPLLLALGLPPAVANATNRAAVLPGLLTALWRFQKAGAISWKLCLRLLPVFLLAAVLGAATATLLPMHDIRVLIDGALLVALALVLLHPDRWLGQGSEAITQRRPRLRLQLLMAAVGLWTGLIVLDAATYLLVSLVLVGGLALPRANAIKVVLLAAATIASLILFSLKGAVVWQAALPLMLGSTLGGWLGAGLALGTNARQWIYRLLIVALGLSALHVLLSWWLRLP